MSEIISLVEAAFAAKRTHEPTSAEFKAAQFAAFEFINKTYKVGAKEEIPVDESTVLPAPVKIVIEKKGESPLHCSFALIKPR